jgi:branched-chain amino acid transport system permease protein
MDFHFSTTLLVAQIVNGIGVGAIYFLIAVGLSLIFGIMDFVNFAHGALYMAGAYAGYELVHITGSFWLALVFAPIIIGLLGLFLEQLLLRQAYRLPHTDHIILTLGIALILVQLVIIGWTAQSKSMNTPAALAGIFLVHNLIFPYYRLFVIAIVAFIALLLWLLLEKTLFGAKLRAGTESLDMASALGINIKRLFSITFGLGAGLAALGGVLVAPTSNVDPFMGTRVLGLAFAVVVVGGMGSFSGAIIAALAIGIIQSVTAMFWPLGANVVVYLFMALVLLTQQAGLLGRKV